MKTSNKASHTSSRNKVRKMTFGDLVAATYRARGKVKAPKILQLALAAEIVRFTAPLI